MTSLSCVGFRISIYLLIVPLCLFYGLILASCTSPTPGSSGLYIAQLRANNQSSVKIGYYGLCIAKSDAEYCVATGFASQESIQQRISAIPSADSPLEAVTTAIKIQRQALINIIAISMVLFLLGLLTDLIRFYSARRERKQVGSESQLRRSRLYKRSSLTLFWTACALSLGAAIANTQTLHTLEQIMGDVVTTGSLSLGLHWSIASLSAVYAVGVSLMHRSSSASGDIGDVTVNPFAASSAARPATKRVVF